VLCGSALLLLHNQNDVLIPLVQQRLQTLRVHLLPSRLMHQGLVTLCRLLPSCGKAFHQAACQVLHHPDSLHVGRLSLCRCRSLIGESGQQCGLVLPHARHLLLHLRLFYEEEAMRLAKLQVEARHIARHACMLLGMIHVHLLCLLATPHELLQQPSHVAQELLTHSTSPCVGVCDHL
jgi:hypothetical protein